MKTPVSQKETPGSGLCPDGAAQVKPGDCPVESVGAERQSSSGSQPWVSSVLSSRTTSEPAGKSCSGAQRGLRHPSEDVVTSRDEGRSRGTAGGSETTASGRPPSLALPASRGQPTNASGEEPHRRRWRRGSTSHQDSPRLNAEDPTRIETGRPSQ